GDLVGEVAVLTAAPRSAAVVALDEVRALVVSADRFRTLLLEQPRVLEVLNRQAAERLADNADRGYSGERVDVASRLAGLLFELALYRGTYATDGAITITMPMTRQDLADWADVSLTEVTWCLNTWQRMGIIEVTGHRVTVTDATGLEKIYGAAITPGPGERSA